ncbi:MAG: AAA family ATPase [Nitrospira sp.]|nr:AAA family ATPase [Nitrospira sp.]
MNIKLTHLVVRTRKTTEEIRFSKTVTFLYGPVGTGKSTVARLVDYCFGGELERTPAIQMEFLSVILGAKLGEYECTFERGAEDTQAVRVTWSSGEDNFGSVNAPLSPGEVPLLDAEVFSLSDLLFHLCGTEPIKVPKRSQDPDSPMIRLSFRDIWRYCYLDQTHLDSSFFRLEDPFRGRKSQDAMRFFTGLHSERLSQLQGDLYRTVTQQQGARQAVAQIRRFMGRFDFGSELELEGQIEAAKSELRAAEEQKQSLETHRTTTIHPTDTLRSRLRGLSRTISDLRETISASQTTLAEQEALRAELITAKVKAGRAEQAGQILDGVDYSRCPQCGSDISERPLAVDQCRLCCTTTMKSRLSVDTEAVRREINDRIDQITDSMNRRQQALERSERELQRTESAKRQLDRQLEDELRRYDSAFIESIRAIDREIAMLEERLRSLVQLQEMPRAISELEEQAGASQGRIDRLRSQIEEERWRLRFADENARAIAEKFKTIMLRVGFPGVSDEDNIVLDPRNWKPMVIHSEQAWGFWDTGSGGKKTLFNVCYALAVHEAAEERGMPVPNILIIDSPTKNISNDENPELVKSLYREIYRFAADGNRASRQFLLIDSDLVEPEAELIGFSQRRMAGESGSPSLISYYFGP